MMNAFNVIIAVLDTDKSLSIPERIAILERVIAWQKVQLGKQEDVREIARKYFERRKRMAS